ncbi:MAG: hypothetical protein LBE07_01345 [Gordonia sp. (in: high G+C Gram-positive bacteria)]|nr:hypothetical protein [Gordonia sp. (in: high G+C Gram-positive bacteria)]
MTPVASFDSGSEAFAGGVYPGIPLAPTPRGASAAGLFVGAVYDGMPDDVVPDV